MPHWLKTQDRPIWPMTSNPPYITEQKKKEYLLSTRKEIEQWVDRPTPMNCSPTIGNADYQNIIMPNLMHQCTIQHDAAQSNRTVYICQNYANCDIHCQQQPNLWWCHRSGNKEPKHSSMEPNQTTPTILRQNFPTYGSAAQCSPAQPNTWQSNTWQWRQPQCSTSWSNTPKREHSQLC